MLTSKDVLERTGISRATLNNYIATGLLPRPEVLPPNPEDGAAPRIGYFPDGTDDRVLEIQRLKREGWSIPRIAAHFAGGAPARPALAATPAGRPAGPASPPAATFAPPSRARHPAVSLAEIPSPAFLLDDGLAVVWTNDAAHEDQASPLRGVDHDARAPQVLERLLAWRPDARALQFVVGLARQRGLALQRLAADLSGELRAGVESAFAAAPLDPGPVAQITLPGPGHGQVLQAVQFREGILFVCSPAPQTSPARAAGAGNFPVPALLPVAVLVTTLQDAHALWLRLPAREYFELVSQVWAELDVIYRELGGHHASHPGDGMVCYFLPQSGGDYLAQALAASLRTREAMRRISSRWQSRKGWDVELRMNTGLDAGQEWIGPLRLVDPVELSVLGAAADQAGELSRAGRDGSVWLTRGLVDRLPSPDRDRLQYGVPRRSADGSQARVLASFSRLQDLASTCGTGPVPAAMADLPVTELLELAPVGRPPSNGPSGA